MLLGKVLELPLLGSYHTELAAYVGLRTGRHELEALATFGLGAFYGGLPRDPLPEHAER